MAYANITVTTQTQLGFVTGEFIQVISSSTVYIFGQVVTYNSGTGVLVFTPKTFSGTGAFTSWTVVGSGSPGQSTLAIGQTYAGGKVFYIDDSGRHGLIVSTIDLIGIGPLFPTTFGWDSNTTALRGANRDGVNAGYSNTERAIISQTIVNIFANQVCGLYNGGSYGDWYLPSKYELNLLYLQRTIIGGLSGGYWSSTEIVAANSWSQNFTDGVQSSSVKTTVLKVRGIRAF